MRINQSVLMQHTRQFVRERSKKDRSLICVYLSGSMLEESPLINGAGDIDLIFVHAYSENMEREIIPIADDIHFDIQHFSQTVYEDPKKLRRDAWMGDNLWRKPHVFFEQNHWFDFTLAGAFSQFTSGENILWRSKRFIDLARGIQQKALFDGAASSSLTRLRYLLAIEASTNAIVSLVGSPLPLRRLMFDFPSCAVDLGKPEMTAEFISLFSKEIPDSSQMNDWIDAWGKDYGSLVQQGEFPFSLHPLKKSYYEKAILNQLDDFPAASLWILARTWCAIMSSLKEAGENPHFTNFIQCLSLDENSLETRFEQLDTWINAVEDLQDERAVSEGLLPMSDWDEDFPLSDIGGWYKNWGCDFSTS